jgi:hypothetical protein
MRESYGFRTLRVFELALYRLAARAGIHLQFLSTMTAIEMSVAR